MFSLYLYMCVLGGMFMSDVLPNIIGPLPAATYADIVAIPIHSLAHDQCPPFGVVLRPLHLPHQLEVGMDGGAAITRPLQIVEHHYIEGIGMVLRRGS